MSSGAREVSQIDTTLTPLGNTGKVNSSLAEHVNRAVNEMQDLQWLPRGGRKARKAIDLLGKAPIWFQG
jgi:hypothetical protein